MGGKEKILCPMCGRLFTQAGFLRHSSHCKKTPPGETPTIEKIRKLTRNR